MQDKLAEEQARLNQKRAQLEQIIADAPRRQLEEERRQREDLIARASQGSRRLDASGSLVDKRYDAQTLSQTPLRRKGLRSHRRAARLQFFALCILLLVLVIVVLKHIP